MKMQWLIALWFLVLEITIHMWDIQKSQKSFLTKITVNNTKPDDWRKKHNTEKNKSLPQLPPVGTYTPIVSDSFAKIQSSAPAKRAYWGGEKRFRGLFGSSSIGPGPETYAQLSKLLAKGIEKSIYQD